MNRAPSAVVLPTHTSQLFEEAVRQAAALLRAGQLVALPTETVYGLAANAFNVEAVQRIFQIKGRPARNPIIVHVAGLQMARSCAAEWSRPGEQLAKAFWPGPLTLVLKRAPAIPDIVTAGGPTVGVRWPSHPLIQAVIQQCGFPLAAPSANPANRVSPTNAEHVRGYFGDQIPMIVDGGQAQVGIESTVVDVTAWPPRLLRPGMIHEQALLAVTGELALGFGDSEQILKSPGLLEKHYSPKARIVLWSWTDERELRDRAASQGWHLPSVHVIAHTRIPSEGGFGRVSVIPHDAEAFGRAIYAELHACDAGQANWIVVEAVPQNDEWRAIADRLKRAAG